MPNKHLKSLMIMKAFPYSFIGVLIILIFFSCNGEKEKEKEIGTLKNRLSTASSPYLLEHADNPVDWYEWGSEALEKAKNEDKPIIISIGYAACHWCHVMEEETFMDSTVAAIMNKDFISIKIDKEERPDIDKIYMHAAQLLNGSGGWPLNAVTLPDGRPFFAGTYFTTEQWKNILQQIIKVYKADKPNLIKTAEDLTNGIKITNGLDSSNANNSDFSKDDYINLLDKWKRRWDNRNGGYKGYEKFPLPVSWEALLQFHYLTGNEEALKMVNTTLEKMARGGLYDQLGGGFARYTTDEKWLVPHFEKMLYDNAQLISLYSKAYKLTGNEEYKETIRQSIKFVQRELSNGKGAYFSSINADSDGEEGKYYVWSLNEINEVLNPYEADLISSYYNIKPNGNWEKRKNILFRRFSPKDYSSKEKLSLSDFQTTLRSAEGKLLEVREKRVKPTIDDKVLTSWNALMIQAYLDAYAALGDPEYLEKAVATGYFLLKNTLKADGGLWRSYKNGQIQVSAFLDDFAYLIEAFTRLYQTNFDLKWLKSAEKLSDYTIKNFWDKDQTLFYYTDNSLNDLIVRKIEIDDNVLASSNSVMAHNLYVMGNLLDNKTYLQMSNQMLGKVAGEAMENPSYYANWINLLGKKTFGVYEIAIVGKEAFVKNSDFQKKYLPNAIFMGGETENLPLLKSKLVKGETLIYVCQNKTCKYPVSGVNEALRQLENNQNIKEAASSIWN